MNEDTPYSLMSVLGKVKDKERPPIHLWHPDIVKDIDMVIKKDGTWMYMGTPITRRRLVHLFSTVLRKEEGEFYLVSPGEKCRISVEDAPFQAILLSNAGEAKNQKLNFTTDMAEEITAGQDHPLRFKIDAETEEPSPYLMVRDRLEAKLTRSVYYQLTDLMVSEIVDSESWFGVWSDGVFFKMLKEEK